MKSKRAWLLVAFFSVVGISALALMSADISQKTWYHTGEQRKFGATYMTMSNPYFEVLNEALKEAIEVNGDILITRDPSQDPEKQNEQILEMINAGVSMIFLQPVDWKAVKPALIACQQAGIPVISVDAYVYDQEYVVSTIASDNYGAGVLCAQDIMRKRKSAKIVMLEHNNMQSVLDRVRGFTDTLNADPRYEIVMRSHAGGELETGMTVMHEILNMNIAFDVLFGGNDPMTLGGLAALQKERRTQDVLIYGVDGSPDAKAMILEGYMVASAAQQPILLAKTAAETAYRYLDGQPVPKEIAIPVTLETKGTLAGMDIDGWQ